MPMPLSRTEKTQVPVLPCSGDTDLAGPVGVTELIAFADEVHKYLSQAHRIGFDGRQLVEEVTVAPVSSTSPWRRRQSFRDGLTGIDWLVLPLCRFTRRYSRTSRIGLPSTSRRPRIADVLPGLVVQLRHVYRSLIRFRTR